MPEGHIDIERERVFPISQGPAYVKKSKTVLWRYIRIGVLNKTTGETIYLEKLETPTLKTSVEAYVRFLKKLNGLP